MPDNTMKNRIEQYVQAWTTDQRRVRPFFLDLVARLSASDARLDFVVREGVSASLRAAWPSSASDRPLFCLVDVVQDVAGAWLSVCFYADSVTDPEDLGNLVPKGLLGEDGYCFDVEAPDAALEQYLAERLAEAAAVAQTGNIISHFS